VIPLPAASSRKRERTYGQVKSSAKGRGQSTKVATRTANKERTRAGASRTTAKTATKTMSSVKRAAQRPAGAAQGPTFDQLYNEAKRRNLQGRSSMNKAQLARKLGR
jgi:hypothetical protein